MTKHEIIDLVANTYNSTNRATNGGSSCLYLDGAGNMCGVGMTLTDPRKWETRSQELVMDDNNIGGTGVCNVFKNEETLWAEQKEEFRGHDLSFWGDIQKLHDAEDNWDINGLSDEGNRIVLNLKRYYV